MLKARRAFVIAFACVFVAVAIYLFLTPREVRLVALVGDKVAHVGAFGLMMMLCAAIVTTRKATAWIAFVLIALGIAIELAQSLTGYRDFEADDMLADTAGVLIAWAAVALSAFLDSRRSSATGPS
jgi:VanZ family protein